MRAFKHQFEIRYTPMLNFNSVYKAFLGHFLRNIEFAIHNEHTKDENVVLRYNRESYQIEFRWDRIIFISEGNRNDLDKAQGPLFNFFEIFDKLCRGDTSVVVLNALVSGSFLIEVDDDVKNIFQRFKNKYIAGVNFDFAGFAEDYSITQEFKKDDKLFRAIYGPFDYKVDVKNHILSPILQLPAEYFKQYKGLNVQALYFEKLSAVDFNTFLAMNRKINENVSRINL
jgi:hypothetical protein